MIRSLTRLFVLWLSMTCAVSVTLAASPADPDAPALAPAPGCFLVAQRGLYGPYFTRTVIYLLQHGKDGSVGLIVNRPLGKRVADMLPDMHSFEIGAFPVYNGGPLSPHIMVMLFRGDYQTELALPVRDGVYASSNLAMLGVMLKSHKPESELRMFAGQANWEPGQLQQELGQHAWYVLPGNPDLLFGADSTHLWQRLINQVDPVGIVASN
jgi:putative transcriptional regulator